MFTIKRGRTSSPSKRNSFMSINIHRLWEPAKYDNIMMPYKLFLFQTYMESRNQSIGEQQTSGGKWILELFHEQPSYACCAVAL